MVYGFVVMANRVMVGALEAIGKAIGDQTEEARDENTNNHEEMGAVMKESIVRDEAGH